MLRSKRLEIDDVAEQEQLAGRVATQEFEQPVGLARANAKMDIRQEDRTDLVHHCRLVHIWTRQHYP